MKTIIAVVIALLVATPAFAATVELNFAWDANTEPDLAGYNVYRISGRTKDRLNKSPVKENTFLDEKLLNERFVAYAVSAVDNAGNESELSQESIVILKE